jgi:hypothetical protein
MYREGHKRMEHSQRRTRLSFGRLGIGFTMKSELLVYGLLFSHAILDETSLAVLYKHNGPVLVKGSHRPNLKLWVAMEDTAESRIVMLVRVC